MKTIIMLALFGLVLSIEPRESARGPPPIPINPADWSSGDPSSAGKKQGVMKVNIKTRGEEDWCAKLYEDGGYSGWEKVIQETTYLNLGEQEIRNPQTSSVRVKPGCTLYLFKFSGFHLMDSFTADVSALGKHNDQAKSLICICQDWCAKLYNDKNYEGNFCVIQETSHRNLNKHLGRLGWLWNDKASSAIVKPGCTLNLFENHNNEKFMESLTADASSLKKNDKVSSVSCTCQAGLKNLGKACWKQGCNKQQGKCDWCGVDGWCCRRGAKWDGNGCDGTRGGINNHQCVPKDW